MNLLQLLLGTMTSSNSVNSVSKKTGASSSLVSKLMIMAIPLLLKYLTKNASSREGQQSLLSALTQHKNTNTIADQIKDADEVDGGKIIGHILGNDKDNVVSSLAKETGLSASQVSSVLSSIAPSLMSGLSAATTQTTSNKNDVSSLLSMFGGKPSTTSATQNTGISSLLGALGGNDNSASSGLGALTSLLGGGNTSNSTSNLLGSLLGGSNQKQSAFDGSDLLSLLSSLK